MFREIVLLLIADNSNYAMFNISFTDENHVEVLSLIQGKNQWYLDHLDWHEKPFFSLLLVDIVPSLFKFVLSA